MGFLDKLLGSTSEAQVKKLTPMVKRINELEGAMAALTDAELRAKTPVFMGRAEKGESLDALLPEAFAAVREAARRTIGQRHYDVQLLGGIVLHQGRIAEMKTGEGKTITETLPAYLNALTGKGVHIVTVNDYLAERDAQWMGKIYKFLGLSVGCVLHDKTSAERREAYRSHITYGTNNELGFDYLRDNMVVYRDHMVQRELNYAIVDEVDSILIDEARTPLIISGHGEESTDMYERAERFVRGLERGENIVKLSKSDQMMGVEQPESGDYMADIKARTVALTQRGMAKAEKFFQIDDISRADYSELNHHIHQALKAHALFQLDVDYVVQDGKVLIVDEFTGRLMLGRRYSDGLHQALEAKEGVKVERENRTLATITFQNYFRMYKKLAGMTGTAKTEEQEFQAIYDLDVVEIPTNRPLDRKDNNDAVYTNERAKLRAVANEVEEVHKTGRPILVGTISVEKSELLSSMLSRRGIKHQVLNAKMHAREAAIVAQAGKYGNVTIATNMAGRGTDILLGGNPEFLARQELLNQGMEPGLIEEATGHAETDDEAILDARARYAGAYAKHKEVTDKEHDQVVAVGGLHIIGTERHESRRIDNQLRGRAGRQGDPGSTRFYVSMEDELMQRFGGERVKDLIERINPDEDLPIEAGILTKQIEGAQKRVESFNFDIRKNVLQYDDVMNRQREIIYGQRRKVLMGEDIHGSILDMIHETVDIRSAQFCPGSLPAAEWDREGLRNELVQLTGFDCGKETEGIADAERLAEAVREFAREAYGKKGAALKQAADQLGVEFDMGEMERVVLLRSVDEHWMDHIDAMDQLRQGIGLQSIAQRDPVVAYRNAGFDMFDEMIQGIRERTVRGLYHVVISAPPVRRQVAKPIAAPTGPMKPKRAEGKISRNAPCPCGSGKKYKHCCGKDAQ